MSSVNSILITGKIAKIIDEYQIVINRGFEHGVKEGMRFVIYSEGEPIIDPENGENLGKYEIVKGKVIVINAQKKFSTAQSDQYMKMPTFADMNVTAPRRIPLSIGEKAPLPSRTDFSIKNGDKVRQIPDQ